MVKFETKIRLLAGLAIMIVVGIAFPLTALGYERNLPTLVNDDQLATLRARTMAIAFMTSFLLMTVMFSAVRVALQRRAQP